MSTPTDRIREAVEKAAQEQRRREATLQEETNARQKALDLMRARAGQMAQIFKSRAVELAHAHHDYVPMIWLDLMHAENPERPGFTLRVGNPTRSPRGIQAVPTAEGGWNVTVYDGGTRSYQFFADRNLEEKQDELLEPLVRDAALALVKGEEPP